MASYDETLITVLHGLLAGGASEHYTPKELWRQTRDISEAANVATDVGQSSFAAATGTYVYDYSNGKLMRWPVLSWTHSEAFAWQATSPFKEGAFDFCGVQFPGETVIHSTDDNGGPCVYETAAELDAAMARAFGESERQLAERMANSTPTPWPQIIQAAKEGC